MTGASAVEVYYDPYDFAIDDDPYPTWKRLRDEAPLYHNEKYNFYALSRYDDVARELPNWETYRSGRGTTMDIILSGMEVPPGLILFEDPPIHDLHRRLLSRVFTPRRMEAIEPLTRRVLRACARPPGRLGPVRLHRRHRRDDPDAHDRLPAGHSRTEPGDDPRQLEPVDHAEGWRVRWSSRGPVREQLPDVRRLHRLAGRPSVRRPDDATAQRGGGGGRHTSAADPHRGAHVHQHGRRCRQRDDDAADRLRRSTARRASGSTSTVGGRLLVDPRRASRKCCATRRRHPCRRDTSPTTSSAVGRRSPRVR